MMGLTKQQTNDVEVILKKSLRRKFEKYEPEPAAMPFHTRLLGKDRLALYSFIHSLNTNFGTSIFEPVAKLISFPKFETAELQVTAGNTISESAQRVIQNIMDDLASSDDKYPDKLTEIEAIRSVCRDGKMKAVKTTKVDLLVKSYNNELFLFDIKTAKPNRGSFQKFKRTLLEWVAIVLADNPEAKVHTCIAIPYNPYEPKPYTRWTFKGIIDLKEELKVAEGLWDFLGGEGAYQDLLLCFERVGIELRSEIDEYFAKYNKN